MMGIDFGEKGMDKCIFYCNAFNKVCLYEYPNIDRCLDCHKKHIFDCIKSSINKRIQSCNEEIFSEDGVRFAEMYMDKICGLQECLTDIEQIEKEIW